MSRLGPKRALGLAAGLLLAVCITRPAAADLLRAEREFAVRRAALELAAGRPDRAMRVLDALDASAWHDDGERVELAALLHAQARLLAGHRAPARVAFDRLATSSDDFVRAQVAAHRLALDGFTQDSTGVAAARAWLARAWLEHADGYSKRQRADAAAGDVLAALVLLRVGDDAGVHRALERVERGSARGVALALHAEHALAVGEFERAAKRFERLAGMDEVFLDAWLHDWAALGRAVTAIRRERPDEARDALARVRDVDLVPFARVLRAQLDWQGGDLEAARAALSDPALASWRGKPAVEAALLRVQVELDAGNFGAAEAHAAALVERLPEWLVRDDVSRALQPELRIDRDAWHGSRVRATLARLADADLLRDAPKRAELARARETFVLMRPGTVDTSTAYLTLLRPFADVSPVLELEEPTRDAARDLRHRRVALRAAQSAFDVAARQLEERRRLLERALAALDALIAELERVAHDGSDLASRLDGYRDALGAQESHWLHALRVRMRALRESLAQIEHGVARLEARFPEDRSVRAHVEIEQARASMRAAHTWMATLDSLHTDLERRVPERVHAVLHQLEPEQVAQALARLQSQLEALRAASARLHAALGDADAHERHALERARTALATAQAGAERARAEFVARWALLQREYAWDVEAHRRLYQEAAREAEATAAFLSALDDTDSTRTDAERLARFEHAAMLQARFVREHPDAARADEMWYRLGETHLQRAGLAHRLALGRYLASGGDAADVPLPVENYADALDAYGALLERHPRSARVVDAHFQMGFLMAEIALPEASAMHLEQFLAQAPADDVRRGNAALRLGEDYLDLGDRERALDAYAIAASVADPEVRHLGLYKMAWCAYDLDRNAEAREALRALLAEVPAHPQPGSERLQLAAEALELLALSFAADHQASQTAAVLDTWERPHYDFALLRRMAQLFTSRALYDEAIQAWEIVLDRHPTHPHAAGAAVELLRVVELHEGADAAHARAARLAPRFAPDGDWSRQVRHADGQPLLQPVWQSRLLEEDLEVVRADSVAAALARPDVAATHMARRMRRAAVYAHQRARRDTSVAASALRKAASLYEHTLGLFPGAEDESTTWLYLGEARYELEDYAAAADAYASAATHAAADSSTRARGATLELAALDAASAADAAMLERYEGATRRYLEHHPRDRRGLDALERVGSLAFAAERYEQAENAYSDLAERVPDPERAAAARKVVGDTWWQREDYDRAADAYETAWASARQAGADSLSAKLAVLVPGAVYRAAGAEEQRGNARAAAERFERVATQHPQFEFADQALYRAAQMRSADGDSARAAQDLELFVRDFRGSALHPDALLELAALQRSREPERAARTYRALAEQHPAHAEARNARLAAAELFETSGDRRAADAEYRAVLDTLKTQAHGVEDSTLVAHLWMRRARLAPSLEDAAPHYESALAVSQHLEPVERAEAVFQLTERQRPGYESVVLRQPLEESLARKKSGLETVLQGYKATIEAGVEPWHAAASLRLGESLMHLGDALQQSEPPDGLGDDDLIAYRGALAEQAHALEGRAVEAWSTGLRAARAAALEDAWRRDLEARLYPALLGRVPLRPAPHFVIVEPQ